LIPKQNKTKNTFSLSNKNINLGSKNFYPTFYEKNHSVLGQLTYFRLYFYYSFRKIVSLIYYIYCPLAINGKYCQKNFISSCCDWSIHSKWICFLHSKHSRLTAKIGNKEKQSFTGLTRKANPVKLFFLVFQSSPLDLHVLH